MRWLLLALQPFAALLFWSLKKYQQQERQLPLWYFFSLYKVVMFSAHELLVIRGEKGSEEILLTKRPANDPYFANQWHFPGTVTRYTDSDADVHGRLADELGLDVLPAVPKVFSVLLRTNERGRNVHIFYRLDVASDIALPNGTFFPLHGLPKDIIPSQGEQISELLEMGKL